MPVDATRHMVTASLQGHKIVCDPTVTAVRLKDTVQWRSLNGNIKVEFVSPPSPPSPFTDQRLSWDAEDGFLTDPAVVGHPSNATPNPNLTPGTVFPFRVTLSDARGNVLMVGDPEPPTDNIIGRIIIRGG